MLTRLILYLIRRKLGLKKYEGFRFVNQKSKYDWYMITDTKVMKIKNGWGPATESNVRLNWLLDDECEIVKVNGTREIENGILRASQKSR